MLSGIPEATNRQPFFLIEVISVEDYVRWVSVQTECKNWLVSKLNFLQKK